MGCGYEVRRETKTILRSPAIFFVLGAKLCFLLLPLYPSFLDLLAIYLSTQPPTTQTNSPRLHPLLNPPPTPIPPLLRRHPLGPPPFPKSTLCPRPRLGSRHWLLRRFHFTRRYGKI